MTAVNSSGPEVLNWMPLGTGDIKYVLSLQTQNRTIILNQCHADDNSIVGENGSITIDFKNESEYCLHLIHPELYVSGFDELISPEHKHPDGTPRIVFDGEARVTCTGPCYEYVVIKIENVFNDTNDGKKCTLYIVGTHSAGASGLYIDGLYSDRKINREFLDKPPPYVPTTVNALQSGDILLVLPNPERPKEQTAFAFVTETVSKCLEDNGISVYIANPKRFSVEDSNNILFSPTAILWHGQWHRPTVDHYKNTHNWSYSTQDSNYDDYLNKIIAARGNDQAIANILVDWYNTRSRERYVTTASSIKHQVLNQLGPLKIDVQSLAMHVENHDIEHLDGLFQSCCEDWTKNRYTHFSPFQVLMRAWYLVDKEGWKNAANTRIIEVLTRFKSNPKICNRVCVVKGFDEFAKRYFDTKNIIAPILHDEQQTLKEFLVARDKDDKLDTIHRILGMESGDGDIEFDLLEVCMFLDILFLFGYKKGFDVKNFLEKDAIIYADMTVKKFVQEICARISAIGDEFEKLKEMDKLP